MVSTADVEPRHRLAYWTEQVCATYVQLECEVPDADRPLEGEIVAHRLASLELSRVTASAQTVRRTPAKIRRDSEDYFLVGIQTQGTGVILQDGREALLRPGDFALFDSTRPNIAHYQGEFQQLLVKLPGRVMRTALRDADSLTARAVSSARGAGQLLISMIATLSHEADTLAPASVAAVAESVTHILVAGLASLPEASGVPAASAAELHRARIRAAIRARFRDPGFDLAELAAALRVSQSTLHRVWAQQDGSLSAFLWAARLDAAHAELCDIRFAAHSVSEIAFGCGFRDAAHFSRAFRARFGCPPSEVRPRPAR
jgi:AraC-like DNA-binding protein